MSNIIDLVSRLKEKHEIDSEMTRRVDPTLECIEEDLVHLSSIIDHCYKLYFGLPISSHLQHITYKDCDCYFTVVYTTTLKYGSKHPPNDTYTDILTKFQTMLAVNMGRCYVINNRDMEVPSKLLDYNDITMKFSAISEVICRINHSENLQKGIDEIKEILASKNQSTE